MIFSTLNQLNCVFVFLFFGLICGIFFIFFSIVFLLKYQKKYQKNIFFCIFSAIFIIFFAILQNIFNLGKFSLTLFCAYLIAFIWTNKLFKNLVVFLQNKWYTTVNKIFKLKRKTNESKHRQS